MWYIIGETNTGHEDLLKLPEKGYCDVGDIVYAQGYYRVKKVVIMCLGEDAEFLEQCVLMYTPFIREITEIYERKCYASSETAKSDTPENEQGDVH